MTNLGYTTHLEQIFQRERERNVRQFRITGTISWSLLSIQLLRGTWELPHLVVVPSPGDVDQLRQSLNFWMGLTPELKFSRRIKCLKSFEISPASGLVPSSQHWSERISFLWGLSRSHPQDIFITDALAISQKTLPFDQFKKHQMRITKSDEIRFEWAEKLHQWGYTQSPFVEDVGQFSLKGGVVDFFSPNYDHPIRIQLFGNVVESIRTFDPTDQSSNQELEFIDLILARECFWDEADIEKINDRWQKTILSEFVDSSELEEMVRHLQQKKVFSGMDLMLPYFFEELSHPHEYFNSEYILWKLDPTESDRLIDLSYQEWKSSLEINRTHPIRPNFQDFFTDFDGLDFWNAHSSINWGLLDTETGQVQIETQANFPSEVQNLPELDRTISKLEFVSTEFKRALCDFLKSSLKRTVGVIVGFQSDSLMSRWRSILETEDIPYRHFLEPNSDFMEGISQPSICLILANLNEVHYLKSESTILIQAEIISGKKLSKRKPTSKSDFEKSARLLSFGDLQPGDRVVHQLHGIGQYEGLKKMSIEGVDAEFLQIAFRDQDKLYLPVYRVNQIQKYAGVGSPVALDKLGGSQWDKIRTNVKRGLKDIARDLLVLYAQRQSLSREPFAISYEELHRFEGQFPFTETDDQLKAIEAIKEDLASPRPMDRLICGDVGFGKTEVALRATLMAVSSGRQVALLAPTTVLTFQHEDTFKKRFSGWPYRIETLNRFKSSAQTKDILKGIKSGEVQIVVGTHRLLSKDVEFKDLGLLIIDEEQRFGVNHKEKLKRMRLDVDTLALSATPIPRTLNMSLLGLRDLSLMNTAPVDRLPVRTFISPWNSEIIRKSIQNEIDRGGQVFFIHNRIHSIDELASELREILPGARLKVAHGQMEEHMLEETMIAFYKHEIDVLVCTAIVESGIDNPRANTMFVDQPQLLGLSQLYQLRGRVGRSTQRAYCYLLLPKRTKLDAQAQERLKILQENSSLGSGIRIAQYDLELRGTGDLLGESQSGHINAVGYEMYMELLEETIHELKGLSPKARPIEPEINLRVEALIPDSYMPDLRLRLRYYKALSEIGSEDELMKLETEIKDQFGTLPVPVQNLMGLMLIRKYCADIGTKDLSAGTKNISLQFIDNPPFDVSRMIQLATAQSQKFTLTPGGRLSIRMQEITWSRVLEEILQLKHKLIG